MEYESRLYIVKEIEALNYAEVIARFDCSKIEGGGWKELFDKPLECKMYAEDGDTEIKEDNYGEKLKYTDFPTVISWLEKEVQTNKFRRLKPLLSLLKGFDLSEWKDGKMRIVHFGY